MTSDGPHQVVKPTITTVGDEQRSRHFAGKVAGLTLISHPTALLVATALMACALLIAGLWPFQFFTTNHAQYDRATGCLLCDRFTSAYLPLRLDSDRRNPPLTTKVESQLFFKGQPSYPYFARILTFFDTSTKTETITIGQWKRNLIVRVRKAGNETGLPIMVEQDADSFFTGSGHCTITVRIDREKITVYAGHRSMEFNGAILPDAAIMIVGNSPWNDSPWIGEICLRLKKNIHLAADSFIADSDTIPALIVPRFFRPVAMLALRPLWEDFTMSKWYTRDIALNFAGFVPFGYLLIVLLYRRFRLSFLPATAIGIGIGFLTSLTIELLQVFLPYRSSQMSDVVFNTLGTAFGAMLFLMWKGLRYRLTTGPK